ncbi:protein TIC110, chloroplastic [Nymphaea colorata]|nr:protein TIC110, chloroplastic [Nymphaea colorata]
MDVSRFSIPSSSTPLLFSPFTKNSILKKNPNSLPVFSRTRRFKLSVARNSSSATSESPPDTKTRSSSEIFGPELQLSGFQKLVDAVPLTARYAGSAVVVAGALAAGYALGFRIKGTQVAAVGGAVALGAVGGAAAFVVNSAAPGVAAVNLHNKVAACDDPELLNKEEIEELARRYGVSKQNEEFNAELCDLYNRFVSSVIPPGSESLQGDEADKIVKFKNALGIDDPDAANVHMEIGRRIYRQRLETGDRDADVEQRRAFQKLVYVSNLVFGEASTFLLPWKRVFKVTDAQVEVAIRDNAQRLYSVNLRSIGRDVNEQQLIDLRAAQLRYKLSNEIAADLLMEHNRKLVEENISAALDMVKSRSRIKESAVVSELEKILSFNNLLISLKNHPQFNLFPPGIGPVSLLGGEYDGDRKIDDLKLLYRAFLTEALSDGHIEEKELSALNHLRNIFGLGKRETEAIMLEVTSKAYRKRLSQAVTRGDLEIATSKAAFLQNLCDELRFDPQKASEIHEDIYRQKLQLAVSDGALSDDDVASLLRLRVLLCIPQQTIDAAHADICGSLFEKVVRDVINAGVDGYDDDLKARVRKASQGLRLTRDASMAIVSKAVRKAFVNFVKRSKAVGNGIEAAKELKKMVAFNTVVVTEMIADIKGESPASESEPIEVEHKPIEEEEPEWESIETLRKTRPDKELQAKLGKPGQTEITLKDDLSERERADLYRTYLLYCISGEVTVVPFGGQIITKKDDSEYFLLNQLGQILGMSGKEVVDVHRNLAEQAFSEKARVILADGQLTKERIEQLNEVQKQVGLPSELAQKVIKGITTTKMAAAIETAVSRGRITIKQVRELKEANVDLDSMISLHLRENLFKKTVDEIFSSGTGEFDDEEVYEKIPADLGIDVDKSRGVVHELAKNRLSNSLLQAVALLRQKNQAGVVSSLNDMLACDKAVPSEPLPWSVPEELADLFCIYLHSEAPEDKVSRLQYLLGISDTTAAALRERGLPSMGAEEEFVF